ncbi:LacI family DNA-binding transcriptional regulator [Kocuria coralli]|nr:LacI family DNA-binding transcriptional regulator [Kocuria coralli]
MEDVARHVGVSRALVSLAYRNRPGVSTETRERILHAGRELGYVPNRVAARLAGHGGNTLGVFLQDLHNDLFADLYEGTRAVADEAHKHLVLGVGALDGGRDAEALETLAQSRVDVVVAFGLQLPDTEVRTIAERVPMVCVLRGVADVDSVVSDNRHGARAATEHLIDLGHRRIAFLANPPSDGYMDRRHGYMETIAAAGLRPQVVQTTYSRETAAKDAGALLDGADAPTAIFAHNDQAAMGVLDALALRGLTPGRDVSVIGYDNSSLSKAPGTSLTTVDVDGVALGRSAAELALRRIEAPGAPSEWRTSFPTLVVRSTTGAPAA